MADTLLPNPDGTYAMPEVVWIPLANLEPGPGYRTQLRDMEELENSIRQFGVLTPLWVQPDPKVKNRYIVFAGRRRYEAARKIARERCDSSLDAPVAVQVGRYLVPCRVFRDLERVHQALLALTENVARRDPSAVDTARELRRIKALLESETGRPVKPEDIISMLCGTDSSHKGPGKRHLYRLLRIGEIDAEAAAAAKEHHLASDFLEQIARLPGKDEQIELVGLIADLHLTRDEVRKVVNQKLSARDASLRTIVTGVTAASRVPSVGAKGSDVTLDDQGEVQEVEKDGVYVQKGLPCESVAMGECCTDGGGCAETGTSQRMSTPETSGVVGLVQYLRTQADVDLLRAGDVLEAWAVSERRQAVPGDEALSKWLSELAERGHDVGELQRLRAILQGRDYSQLEVELMRLLYMYQGVLAEHLPGYVGQIGEAMGESAWYQRLVRCFLELTDLLRQPEGSKRVGATPRRLVDVFFHELFWLSTLYDPRLRYHVGKLPPLRKKEFAEYVLAAGGIGRKAAPTVEGNPALTAVSAPVWATTALTGRASRQERSLV